MPDSYFNKTIRSFLAFGSLTTLCISASAVKLTPSAHIETFEIRECSGIAQSRLGDNVFWVHNDSNGGSNLYAINKQGALIATHSTGLPNIDWEDITTDHSGNLFIGDFGNLGNNRRDLVIYKIEEPLDPTAKPTANLISYRFAYSEQTKFPPAKRIFDCEALFWADDHLFILSKSLGETITRLYRFDSLDPDKINHPTQIGQFDIGPRVTAAEMSSDGLHLAVLTTRSVWVFTRPENSNNSPNDAAQPHNFLNGPAKMLPIQAGQCEAICWSSPEELLIANEDRALFTVPLDSLIEY